MKDSIPLSFDIAGSDGTPITSVGELNAWQASAPRGSVTWKKCGILSVQVQRIEDHIRQTESEAEEEGLSRMSRIL